MVVYNLFVFNKHGECIYYEEWNRTAKLNLPETKRNMYGFLFEMKRFITKASLSGKAPDFFSYTTNTYKLHSFETATGRKFVITTDTSVPDMKEELRKVYSSIFVEYVIKNPLFRPASHSANNGSAGEKDEPLGECVDVFTTELVKYLQSLPAWRTPATLPTVGSTSS